MMYSLNEVENIHNKELININKELKELFANNDNFYYKLYNESNSITIVINDFLVYNNHLCYIRRKSTIYEHLQTSYQLIENLEVMKNVIYFFKDNKDKIKNIFSQYTFFQSCIEDNVTLYY